MTAPPLPLPVVGARGFRVLDALRFACEIVAVDALHQTLSVRFLDDGENATLEDGVELDEFESQRLVSELVVPTPAQEDRFLVPITSPGNSAHSILGRVTTFLEPVEWLATLRRVCRPWGKALLTASQWRTLRVRSFVGRLTQLLDLRLVPEHDNGSTGYVRDVLEAIVLDNSDATDDQVISTVMKCPKLQSMSLRRCQQVTFMVVYELLRLSRERHAAGEAHFRSLDLWFCRGVSPTFVSQLTTPSMRSDPKVSKPRQHHCLDIRGPGFFVIDVCQEVLDALRKRAIDVPHWSAEATTQLDVLWLPETQLLEMTQSQDSPQLRALQRHAPVFKAAALSGAVPLVPFDRLLTQQSAFVFLGIPASTVEDLTRLIYEWEPSQAIQTQLERGLHELAQDDRSNQPKAEPQNPAVADPLTAQAERVFAMLRQTTEQLQRQVDRLEDQVAVMTEAKLAAEREYKHAERELQRIAHEADRAVLRLATSSEPTSSSLTTATDNSNVVEPPPQNGVITNLPDDSLLPALPSSDTIASLTKSLEHQWFALLDGFVGEALSTRVREDVEHMYLASRNAEAQPPVTRSLLSAPPPAPAQARFTLGELAGGNTGRNLRYQMAHVRGDYMLWLDEHDGCCPQSVQQVLRQLDRLILERLSVACHELSMSALLRKKAMVTCYPGKQNARYTRHCDNPNQNGRKLTAILYLNADWDSALQGGELLIHAGDGSRVAPLLDRLVLFFSDTRVPHEVLSCQDATRDRFAITVWYLDYDEYMHAQVFGTTTQDGDAVERQRIEQEMVRLQKNAAG